MPRKMSESGFSVLEAAISMTVLAVALLTLWGSLVYCSRSNLAAEQRKRALLAAQAKIEELKAHPFDTLIADYGPGGTVGEEFAVPTLDDGDGARGRVVFFVDETANPAGEALALPLDLNGDGDTDDQDVSGSFLLLPTRVSVRWEGILGEQRVDLRTILREEDR